ncbi:MAG: hypothetical protein DME53_11075 [Verrucomicrobia bacterium]|nr:MAG: hypothetical protein DME56_09970 [Verrucomicrobiota bacterium]PYK43773.1 MAG: hypothetical protein DME53_11075 [Verrucomicrobiota bacterium]
MIGLRLLQTITSVILSEAKLQRSGRSPRGQAFNLSSILPDPAQRNRRDMFERFTSSFAFRCSSSLNMTTLL